MATATRMTAEQYYDVTVLHDGKQLVEGEIVVHEPKWAHGVLQTRILFALETWVRAGEDRGAAGPPTDIRMDEHNVYGPDVVWFAEEHPPLRSDGYPAKVPELCVEIRSPSTWRYDVGAKKRVYEDGGLPELWLVDGEASTLLVYRRSSPRSKIFDVTLELAPGDTLTSPQLAGFELALAELFAT